MKKILLSLAAVAMLAACSKEDTLVQQAPEAIGFDNAFVENSTRSVNDPSFSSTEANKMFDGFRVYGFVENAPLFKGTEVTGSGLGNTGAWTYEGTQYWVAGANYKFHAVAPITANAQSVAYDVTNGVSFNYTNVNGTEDLLYAYQTATGQTTGNNQKVAFTFDHILSKVKFSFLNGYDASNATLKVTNVKITNAHKTANVALNDSSVAWTEDNSDEVVELDFGNVVANDATSTDALAFAYNTTLESYNECFVLPSTAVYEYNVTFTVELWINGVQVDVDSETTGVQGYNHTATAKFAPLAGNAYVINTTITASNIDPSGKQDPIQFTVTEINDWDTDYNDNAEGDNNVNM